MINRIKHSHCQAVIREILETADSIFPSPCPFQNYLNESLKFLDKAYPNGGGGQGSTPGGGPPGGNLTPNSNLHVSVTTPPSSSSTAASPVSSLMMHQDTKPIYIDSKTLLGHHMHHLADKK